MVIPWFWLKLTMTFFNRIAYASATSLKHTILQLLSCTILTTAVQGKTAFTQGKLHLCSTHRAGQVNTGGFSHVKHTYVPNLHKQKAYAYKLNSPSIKELDYYSILKSCWSVTGWRGTFLVYFTCLVAIEDTSMMKNQSFTKLTLNKVSVRLADAAFLMELELTVVNSEVLEHRIESRAFLSY